MMRAREQNVNTRRDRRRFFARPVAVCGLLLAACGMGAAQDLPASVAARVNGEVITRAQVDAGVPSDAFSRRAAVIRRNRLGRLIDQALLRQHLKARKVTVAPREVEARIAALRKLPPAQQCPCCRFATLEEYLMVEAITLPELRAQVQNDAGLERLLTAQWEQAYPTRAARLAHVASQRTRIQQEYASAWQIFFNTLQLPDGTRDPAALVSRARENAGKASERLQKGETFAKVAREVSEDRMSRDLGGVLGFFKKQAYGGEFAAQLERMRPGELSPPFRTVFGFHIVRREALTPADELAICKQEFMAARRQQLLERLRKEAAVEQP